MKICAQGNSPLRTWASTDRVRAGEWVTKGRLQKLLQGGRKSTVNGGRCIRRRLCEAMSEGIYARDVSTSFAVSLRDGQGVAPSIPEPATARGQGKFHRRWASLMFVPRRPFPIFLNLPQFLFSAEIFGGS
jgi:hypothetical protein